VSTSKERARLERVVNKLLIMARDGMGPVVLRGSVIHLLRLERARVRRIVKQQTRWKHYGPPKYASVMQTEPDGEYILLDRLLAALRGRGTR